MSIMSVALSRTIKATSVGAALVLIAACSPQVGTEAWCDKIEAKAKSDVTAAEAKDYAKHCILRKD